MGITNFSKWIKDTYPSSLASVNFFNKTEKSYYDHVYIDINVILHRIVFANNFLEGHDSTDEHELINRLCSYITNIIKRTTPRKTLTLATDGIAPFAKIILQRKRRLQYIRNIQNTNSILCEEKENKQMIKLPEINPLCFTPGTYFMKSLSVKLLNYVNKLKNIYKIQVHLQTFGKGEAELKLINQLIINSFIGSDIFSKNSKNNESHCIYSSDADIFVIIAATGIKNVFVNNGQNIINFDKLMALHQSKFKLKCNTIDINNNYRTDFSFVSLFMGNDYIPKVSHVTFDKLWEAYTNAFNDINFAAKNTQFLIAYDNNNNTVINKKFMSKLFYLINKKTIKNKKSIFPFRLEDFIVEKYYNYLLGIVWCHDTYRNGYCKKLDYMCDVNIPIHPMGIVFYFEFGHYDDNSNRSTTELNNLIDAIDEEIYATLVLPKIGRNLIEYKKIYDLDTNDDIKILYEIEECSTCISLHKKLSYLHEQINNEMKNKLDGDINKNQNQNQNQNKELLTILLKKSKDHHLQHRDITINDIFNLIKIIKILRNTATESTKIDKLIQKFEMSPVIIDKVKNKKEIYLF
ncbi:MAG: XRN 5'-3' exonuclease [Terrestrivirus sp.]|uniref:XRN 5'-3' exonuclease n=1 Tax=Terrestrivirus sp. TaxID=2487775 RepID=A0A3G4ZSD6_9VIRU|nr:MAG: XRN 5'-3' exonuclease [Terrestrivirus sp.]